MAWPLTKKQLSLLLTQDFRELSFEDNADNKDPPTQLIVTPSSRWQPTDSGTTSVPKWFIAKQIGG
ncbi:hypothetical protein KR51_00001380 [Rubidibacter lacunae KORDI 51-2]|uniref:Uncharacterized protein n=1 Tax=Rubidibacter lacunae KORDI 51-2 TaxID=582515 RepID=U5DF08_9CHRO|nr:hypothetical protein KR51_00001380 [Rubidibacter lacunae KORDI 51-2]